MTGPALGIDAVIDDAGINDPAAVAEVADAFARYEAALVANDTELMNDLFWRSTRTRRFGVADAQTGYDAIALWRSSQPPLPPGRLLHDTQIVAFERDTAVVTTSFTYPGADGVGRQTQVWRRFAEGWKIVSAHVSEIPDPGGEDTAAR